MPYRDKPYEPRWLTQGDSERVGPDPLYEAHMQAGADIWDCWIQFCERCKPCGYVPRTDGGLYRALRALERAFEAEAEVCSRDGYPSPLELRAALANRGRVFARTGIEKG